MSLNRRQCEHGNFKDLPEREKRAHRVLALKTRIPDGTRAMGLEASSLKGNKNNVGFRTHDFCPDLMKLFVPEKIKSPALLEIIPAAPERTGIRFFAQLGVRKLAESFQNLRNIGF
jgi:hypothetical protein